MSTSGFNSKLHPRAAAQVIACEPPRPAPLLAPALALMLGIWLSETVGPDSGTLRAVLSRLPWVALAALLVGWRRGWSRLVLTIAVAAVALGVGFARHQRVTARPPNHIVRALADKPVLTRLAGTIVNAPIARPSLKLNPFLVFEPAARTQFVLAADELRTTDPPTPVVGNVRVSIAADELDLRLGQRVQLTGEIFAPGGPHNPGEMDWSRWYRQQGIDAGLVVEGAAYVIVLPTPASPWYRLVNAARGTARSLLFEPYADLDSDAVVRLLDTMVLGQRSTADQQINVAFLRAGGMHFLAVSGFNVSLLAGAAWWFVRQVLRRGQFAAAVAALVLTLLFALVTEPNAPILRATVAAALAALAAIIRRPICAVNWLALAAGFVLLCNPLELFRAGFQLSFVLVTALVTIVPAVYRIPFGRPDDESPPQDAESVARLVWRKVGSSLGALLVTCLCAYLISLPLVLLHFGRVAPWGWLGTLLLTPLVTFVTLLSLVVMLVHAVLPPLGALLGGLLHWSTGVLLWSVGLFEHLPAAVIECQPPPLWLVLATYAALVAWVARPRPDHAPLPPPRRRAVRGLAVVSASVAALLALGWLGWVVFPARAQGAGFALHVLAVGNGSAALLTTPTGPAALFDVGTDTNSDAGVTVQRALVALRQRRLDLAMISHANVDHYSGLLTLLGSVPVRQCLVSPYFVRQRDDDAAVERLLCGLPRALTPLAELRAGDRLTLGGATLEVLWPPDGLDAGSAANDRSLVVRLSAAGRRVLLTGDIEQGGLRGLLAAHRAGRIDLAADVLLAPHHGSVLKKVTAEFYEAVSPAFVVVSSRTPRPKLAALVAETLSPDTRLVLTGDVGAVTVRITPEDGLRVETPYAPRATE